MELKDLNKTFEDIIKLVPTIVVLGRTADGKGLMMMNSDEEGAQQKEEDICVCIATMIQTNEQVRNIMLASICHFMQQNPEYQKHMMKAIKLMRKTQWN